MAARYERDLFSPCAGHQAEERLRRQLAEAGRCRVELTLTRNRVSMLSVAFVREGHVRVRLHEQFLNAPPDVFDALAHYLRARDRMAWKHVAYFARHISVPPTSRPVSSQRLRTKGKVYDLRIMADEVNATFFEGKARFRIGWGRSRCRPSRSRTASRSIRYGSWSAASQTIRLHPLLDDVRVPQAFVRYIVFHEMLHAAIPEEHHHGRRVDHGALFRQHEERYPDIERMRRLAYDLLPILLRR